MTPEALAELHEQCFTVPRPYSADEFAVLLRSETVFLCPHAFGFALGRAVSEEAELLTLAVRPDRRRAGIGRALLAAFEGAARQRNVARAFLEVSASNAPAIAMYRAAGYTESGRRRGYYRAPDGTLIDALTMDRALDPS